jgi:TonB family protein
LNAGSIRGILVTVGALCAASGPLLAQSRLYAVDEGTGHLVVSADGIFPYIMDPAGKLVKSRSTRFALKSVPEYLPIIVDVREVNVGTEYGVMGAASNRINNTLKFRANLVSPVNLDRVFVVLELTTDVAGRSVFLWGIGKMEAGMRVPLSLEVPTSSELGSGTYHLHVFSDGTELFNTTMGILNIDAYLDAMVSRRVRGLSDAKPAILMATNPTYPQDLKKRHVKGHALVSIRIDDRGWVEDQKLVSATDPAFGAAALASVKSWRFVPLVKGGRAVETVVRMPFDFDWDKGT